MNLLCKLGRHSVISRGIRSDEREFGRCERCRRDLTLKGERWVAVPKGFQVVWRPRTGDELADQRAGAAAIGRETNVRGVVVGERAFGAQRFVLVRLNAEDERNYRGNVDRLGTSGNVALQMEERSNFSLFGSALPDRGKAVSSEARSEMFDWEHKHAASAAPQTLGRLPRLTKAVS